MNNLLEEWRKKKSWNLTFPVCPIYFSKGTGERDILLSNLLGKEPKLTLDLSETGFREIGYDWMDEEVRPEYQYLLSPIPKLEVDIENLVVDLVQRLERYFINLWDSSMFHLVFVSGGLDSRIVSYILMSLREKMGSEWIGKIHFRCHEPEGFIFKQVMESQGWRTDQYSVYKDGQPTEVEDYYEKLFEFSNNANAFNRSPLDFFYDLSLDYDNTQLISGSASTISNYPNESDEFLISPFYGLKNLLLTVKFNFSYHFAKFKDILHPFLSYDFLDLVFRIPEEFLIKTVEVEGFMGTSDQSCIQESQKLGFIRVKMLETFEDKIKPYRGHYYNTLVSEERAEYVRRAWYESAFYKDFKEAEAIKKVGPNLLRWAVPFPPLDNRFYNLATTYENVRR